MATVRYEGKGSVQDAVNKLGRGDTLVIARGAWKTGPVDISIDGVTVSFEEGAELRFSDDEMLYVPVVTRWEGVFCYAMHPLFFIHDCKDVKVLGGTLDGAGGAWWKKTMEERTRKNGPESPAELRLARLNPDYASQPGGGGGRKSQYLRPPLLQTLRAQNVTIDGLKLQNSPFWTLHPVLTGPLVIRNVAISNPSDAPNTDGIDIDSCHDVTVEHCHVHVGDDGIAVKSGAGEDAIRVGVPSEHIRIRDCTVEAAHGGVVIGSETGGGIHDVSAERCIFRGTDRGIRIKTRRGRAGKIDGLSYKDISMENVLCPVTVNMYYVCGARGDEKLFSLDAQPVTSTTPVIRDVTIENITAAGVRSSCAFIAGLPEQPITGLTLKDCTFALAPEADLVAPSLSEMYAGIPDSEERGLRVLNTEAVLENIKGAKVVRT